MRAVAIPAAALRGPSRPLLAVAAVVIGLLFGLVTVELLVRALEPAPGEDIHVRHAELGWAPKPGRLVERSVDFTVTYTVNDLGMRDSPIDARADLGRIRIAAVGDSNTFGVGVADDEAWPNALEQLLFSRDPRSGAVFNLGVPGYSVAQYLVRMREFYARLRPHVVLVGLSVHNDIYDHIPPRMGGFVYGERHGRVYFDLDDAGGLVEHRDLVGKDALVEQRERVLTLRHLLARNVALYRWLRSTHAAVWIASRFRLAGEALWPGIDTALRRELDAADRYRWQLAEALLARLAHEARATGADVVLVVIPHLAIVSDDIWNSTYGAAHGVFDRWIANERLRDIARRVGIGFVDVTGRFIEESRRAGRPLHFPSDRHYTAHGQRLIAEEVARAVRDRMPTAQAAPDQSTDREAEALYLLSDEPGPVGSSTDASAIEGEGDTPV